MRIIFGSLRAHHCKELPSTWWSQASTIPKSSETFKSVSAYVMRVWVCNTDKYYRTCRYILWVLLHFISVFITRVCTCTMCAWCHCVEVWMQRLQITEKKYRPVCEKQQLQNNDHNRDNSTARQQDNSEQLHQKNKMIPWIPLALRYDEFKFHWLSYMAVLKCFITPSGYWIFSWCLAFQKGWTGPRAQS